MLERQRYLKHYNENNHITNDMNNNRELFKRRLRGLSAAVALTVGLGGFTACSQYDLDEHDPEGWGASIYSYLDGDGNFTNTVRLIDDLGMKEVLAKTGSKTMFVADDAAYERFYANNAWGVKNYGQLTQSQKKMLLMGSMINSSYQVDDLSSVEGPVDGQCMRRLSSQTLFDTVSVTPVAELPNMTADAQRWNKAWSKFAERNDVVIMRDMTTPPMLHFIEAHMANNKITNDDYNFLYNFTTQRQPGDASVNGVKMLKQNVKCSNGFIHVMENVITPLDNMAEIIASKPEVSVYNSLLERFTVPFYAGKDITDQYNLYYNTNVDSVFQKRFISEKSQNGSKIQTDDDNRVYQSMLKYDPEWNTYYSGLAIPSASVALEKNMGMMMVPSNAAMQDYWDNGPGRVLKDQYGTWDNVPTDVIVELLNNNMFSTFTDCVPSKFDGILNDANDPMGVELASIDSVWLGCNGAIYLTNKVYSPTSFVSVLYPAVVNQTMKIIKWAVEQCQYNVYLNSLNSYYSFFIPTNDALLCYIDPASYGKDKTQIYRFHYDASKATPVWASVFEYDMATGLVGDSIKEVRDEGTLKSKLRDVLDTHIVIGDVEDGHTYYKTKGGQELRVENVALGVAGMTVEGSLQLNETGNKIPVSYIYDQTSQGNGKCYILDGEPMMTTRKSVLDVMREHEEMSEMTKLLEGSAMIETIHDEKYACVSQNISSFNTFNYTVYVPTNEAILELQKNGDLPTWDDVAQAEEEGRLQQKTSDSLAIENFLQYHIQDGSLFVGAKPVSEDGYETAFIGSNGKFERLYAKLTETDLEVRTSQTDKKVRKVVQTPGLYNLMAREYMLDGPDAKTANNVYTSSTAVIHLIDGALVK